MAPVDIIVPVYRDLAATRRCLESVFNAADPLMGRVIVINDASPEPEVADYCASITADADLVSIAHESNKGFVATVNEGMRLAEDRDVIILNSDTEVPGDWVTRLATAAQGDRIASVTPFSNNATICSYPHFCQDNPMPAGHAVASLSELFRANNAGQTIDIPTGIGFCMFLSRAAIDEVGDFDEAAFGRGYGEENDWCLRASAAGWRHLLCGDLFVFHAGGASFGQDAQALQASAMAVLESRYPDYTKQVAEFIERDPIEPLRFAIDQARTASGEGEAVLAESRSRERKAKAEWYELDKARHEQVTRAHELLAEARAQTQSVETTFQAQLDEQVAAAQEQEAAYSEQLQSLQRHSAEQAGQYQQLEGQYRELENQYGDLQTHQTQLEEKIARIESLWFVRLYRRLTGSRGQS